MVLMELLRKRKGSQHIQNYFHSYCLQLNDLLNILDPSLSFSFTINFASPCHNNQFFLSLSLFSYPYPCHGWFDTPRCNCLILVSPSCYVCLLLATLPLQYQCTSPFRDCLVLLLVSIFFSSSIRLPVIFFSSSLSLVNITLPILVAIASSPRRYHFAYPCNNYLLL